MAWNSSLYTYVPDGMELQSLELRLLCITPKSILLQEVNIKKLIIPRVFGLWILQQNVHTYPNIESTKYL